MGANPIQDTAEARKKRIISALSRELDPLDKDSCASRLASMIRSGTARPVVTGGDIDGLLSAAMLSSVTARVGSGDRWEVVAVTLSTGKDGQQILVHPDYQDGRPKDIFGVDVFSTQFDNVSNHIVLYGDKALTVSEIRDAFTRWDDGVRAAAANPGRLLAAPNLWAEIGASRKGLDVAHGASYKYPLGTAQILLALLEAGGVAPKFFDGQYLPWLLANCDGGVTSFVGTYFPNVDMWWSLIAGAVGPGSLTQMVYDRVRNMLPHDFSNAVHQLAREQERSDRAYYLNSTWNVSEASAAAAASVLALIDNLTGWGDPVRGGVDAMHEWVLLPSHSGTKVPLEPRDIRALVDSSGVTLEDLAASVLGALGPGVTNANFLMGGHPGDRFNWFGGW